MENAGADFSIMHYGFRAAGIDITTKQTLALYAKFGSIDKVLAAMSTNYLELNDWLVRYIDEDTGNQVEDLLTNSSAAKLLHLFVFVGVPEATISADLLQSTGLAVQRQTAESLSCAVVGGKRLSERKLRCATALMQAYAISYSQLI